MQSNEKSEPISERNYASRALDVVKDSWDCASSFLGGALFGSGLLAGSSDYMQAGAGMGVVGITAPTFMDENRTIPGADYTCQDSRFARDLFAGATGGVLGMAIQEITRGNYPTPEQGAGISLLAGMCALATYLYERERQRLTYRPKQESTP